MTCLQRFTRLSSAERALLVWTSILVGVIRLLLSVRPWPGVLRQIRALALTSPLRRSRGFSTERLTWAVQASSRLIPYATCLTQALALQCLLTAAGRFCTVEIGVAKDSGLGMQAHAWVEHDGDTLLSTSADVARYSRMLTLPGPASR